MVKSYVISSRRLVVFSRCAHYSKCGQFVAHGGFVREMELWSRVFGKVLIVTVGGTDKPPADTIPYSAPNIGCTVLQYASSTSGWMGKLRLLWMSGLWTARSLPMLNANDVIMARGPDSLGFLGAVLARIKGLPRFAKYADQWQPFRGEPLGYRLQKAFYRGPWFGGPVQIYGNADLRRPHLVTFFTSSLSESEWLKAGEYIQQRINAPPWRILFCGRFVQAKGIDLLLRAFQIVVKLGLPAELALVGDGEDMPSLVKLSYSLGIQHQVAFHGWLGRDALWEQYRRANIFVSCSRKEGFGKVIIEAMAFGLPIIATDVGVTRYLVNPPDCGLLSRPECYHSLAQVIIDLIENPKTIDSLGLAARARAKCFLFEKLEDQYRQFITDHCRIETN